MHRLSFNSMNIKHVITDDSSFLLLMLNKNEEILDFSPYNHKDIVEYLGEWRKHAEKIGPTLTFVYI